MTRPWVKIVEPNMEKLEPQPSSIYFIILPIHLIAFWTHTDKWRILRGLFLIHNGHVWNQRPYRIWWFAKLYKLVRIIWFYWMILAFFPTTTQKMKTLETTTQPKFCVEFPGFSSVFPALLGNSTLHIAETARLPWAERLCVLPGSNTDFLHRATAAVLTDGGSWFRVASFLCIQKCQSQLQRKSSSLKLGSR